MAWKNVKRMVAMLVANLVVITASECDLRYFQHYEHKACEPVLGKDGCPTKFICNPLTGEDEKTCIHNSKTYYDREEIEDVGPCDSCSCRVSGGGSASIECAEVDCPDWDTKNKSCYMGYKPDSCCPEEMCPNEKPENHFNTCSFNYWRVDWTTAVKTCQNEGKQLLCYKSKKEIDNITSAFRLAVSDTAQMELWLSKRNCSSDQVESCLSLHIQKSGNSVWHFFQNQCEENYPFVCCNHEMPGKTCQHNGKNYRIGDTIATNDPCLNCICTEKWSGESGYGCSRVNCLLGIYAQKIRRGCLPIYSEKGCCPSEVKCDKLTGATPVEVIGDNTDDYCRYQDRYYKKGTTASFASNKYQCATCKCTTPPDFTCLRTSCAAS